MKNASPQRRREKDNFIRGAPQASKSFSHALQGFAFGLIFSLRKSGQQKNKLCELCGLSDLSGRSPQSEA
jgi:hypothetical protein